MKISQLEVTVTRAEYNRSKWFGHDPGDEDEPSWISAPVAPQSSLYEEMVREYIGRYQDVANWWWRWPR